MDLTSTILALGLILLIVVPIALYTIINKQKEKRFQQAFHAVAEKLDLAILDFDRWDNSIIAIDKNHKKLFFYRKKIEEETQLLIELEKVKSCELNITSRAIDERPDKLIDRLDLVFSYSDKNTPLTSVNFYDSHEKSQITTEYHLVEKWEKAINSALKGQKVMK